MAVGTACLVDAALMIFGNEVIGQPVLANDIAVVAKNVGLSPEILPVVSVSAESLVVLFIEWAPLRFVVEQIKI